MPPIGVAVRGKGSLGMIKRAGIIRSRYGLSPAKMERLLEHFVEILSQFDCGATFPITAVTLARYEGNLLKFQAQNIEFAMHGYCHVDYAQSTLDEQLAQFKKARRLFEARDITCDGFRCPYLRWSDDTLRAITQSGLLYDSSQALSWDVVEEGETESYKRVLSFYGAAAAASYPALPRWDQGLMRIPYCLPDDEAVSDRLKLSHPDSVTKLWLAILSETYHLGELFTLGLHPERIYLCEVPLIETLRQARAMSPPIWITRLREVSNWWKARMETKVSATIDHHGLLQVSVDGPEGTVMMARGVELMTRASDWDGVYQRVDGNDLTLKSPLRPFIGVSPSSSPYLTRFLRQQGYIVEQAKEDNIHSIYLERPQFCHEDERPL